MASSGHPSLPFASPLAANRHPRATHQWLLMGVQVCRLPALLQPTGTPGPYINGFSPRPHIHGFLWASKSAVCQPSCSQQAPQGHTSMASYGHPSLPFASPLAANRHPRAIHQWLLPKATHPWLLMGIQVCRLPALLQPTGTPGPHINGFLWASKSAVCQPSNP